MITLFTDLDHTLIFSHRSKPNTSCIPVEKLNGEVQSFMTKKTWNALSDLVGSGKLCVVPVTTRKKEQYVRLDYLTERMHIRYSLICNGAVLLVHGVVDPEWLSESVFIAKDQLEEVYKAENELRVLCGRERTYSPFNIMTYGVSDDAEQIIDNLRDIIDQNKCFVSCDKRKIYCIPTSLNKGMAVKRFQKRFGYEKSVSAGDSEFDIPMLLEADYAVFPESLLSTELSDARFPIGKGKILSDALCDILQYIICAK